MIEEKIKKDYPLAPLTTYQLGGPAEYFVAATTEEELKGAIEWAKKNSQSVTILGGGSNILVNDAGVKGLVIKVDNHALEVSGNNIIVGASRTVKETAELALEKGLTGIEWSIGIPGAIGGGIRGNAGAHGGSFDKVVTSVTVFDCATFEFKTLSNPECHFRYRHSIVKDNPQLIVWEVVLALAPGDKTQMEKEMEEYREYRRTSQPKEPSAGCIFKNFFAADLEKVNSELVRQAEAEGKVRGGKIGAGYLVQKLALKGYGVGGAQISDKHANFIVNMNKATAADVMAVMKHIKEKVKTELKVDMEEEVQLLGF